MTALSLERQPVGLDWRRLLEPEDGHAKQPVGALLQAVKANWTRPGQLGYETSAWMSSQPQLLRAVLVSAQGAVQGAGIGYLLGALSSSSLQQNPQVMGQNPDLSKQLLSLQQGGPWQQARNLAALTATQAGVGAILKAVRGKEDVYGQMMAAFGGGAAFALASNLTPGNPFQSAFTSGVAFAAFTGAFCKIGEAFSGGSTEAKKEYALVYSLLASVGCRVGPATSFLLGINSRSVQYERAIRKGGLSDRTLLLWNDSALSSAGLRPGPRLLVLEHLDTYRDYYTSILKPGIPLRGQGRGGSIAEPPPPGRLA